MKNKQHTHGITAPLLDIFQDEELLVWIEKGNALEIKNKGYKVLELSYTKVFSWHELSAIFLNYKRRENPKQLRRNFTLDVPLFHRQPKPLQF